MSIHKALIEFHKHFAGAEKRGVNPHFKSLYFTLDDLVNATTPALNKAGLVVSHRIVPNDDGQTAALVTAVTDEEGDSIESAMLLNVTGTPQQIISQTTYYKRTQIAALLNVAEAVDDDANAATAPPVQVEMASDEQMAKIREYADAEEISAEQLAWLESRNWTLTAHQAATVLERIKAK